MSLQGHKLNFVTACGLLVWQFASWVVIPTETVSQVLDSPATCDVTGTVLSKSNKVYKQGANCAITAVDSPESCVVDPASVVSDCATGYVPGDAATPSTTCPTGCIFTAAVSSEDIITGSTCAPVCSQPGCTDFTECALTAGSGVCSWVPPTDCKAYFREAAPNQLDYGAMEIHVMQQACPNGCYFTPHIQHEERSTFWRVALVFICVTVPGVVAGYMEDPIRFGDPNANQIKLLSICYVTACVFGAAAMVWYMIFQQDMSEECKQYGHDTLTEQERLMYGEEHKCQVYTGSIGSINLLLTLMSLVTYLLAITGACMVTCGGDGAYGYEEEDDEESK